MSHPSFSVFAKPGVRSTCASATAAPPRPTDPSVLRFTLPYPPTVNLYWRNVNGRLLLSAKGRKFKADVQAKYQTGNALVGLVVVEAVFYRPRKCGDLDNVLKAPLDALKGIAFEDDKQVKRIYADREDDKHNPRVEVRVSQYFPRDSEGFPLLPDSVLDPLIAEFDAKSWNETAEPDDDNAHPEVK